MCVCVFNDSSSTGLFSSVLYFLAQEQHQDRSSDVRLYTSGAGKDADGAGKCGGTGGRAQRAGVSVCSC